MKIIKEYTVKPDGDILCSLRGYHYGEWLLDYFMELFALAVLDFPTLLPADVNVVMRGGTSIKRIMGIEFTIPAKDFGACMATLDTNDMYQPIANSHPTI